MKKLALRAALVIAFIAEALRRLAHKFARYGRDKGGDGQLPLL